MEASAQRETLKSQLAVTWRDTNQDFPLLAAEVLTRFRTVDAAVTDYLNEAKIWQSQDSDLGDRMRVVELAGEDPRAYEVLGLIAAAALASGYGNKDAGLSEVLDEAAYDEASGILQVIRSSYTPPEIDDDYHLFHFAHLRASVGQAMADFQLRHYLPMRSDKDLAEMCELVGRAREGLRSVTAPTVEVLERAA